MVRHSFHRLITALVAVLSLLVAQLALAGYVCPWQQDVTAIAAMVEAGVPCDGTDSRQPALCHQHATDPAKTFEAVKLPVVVQPAFAQVLELPPIVDAGASRVLPATVTSEAQPPPAPLFLSTLRLRV